MSSSIYAELKAIQYDIEKDPNFEAMRTATPGIKYVPGFGNYAQPPIMFIGEAPGVMENAKQKPFVGKAGVIFDELLEHIGYSRERVYTTNVVKYLPHNNTEGGSKFRKPTDKEIEDFRDYLCDEILIVNPTLICLLGNVPLKAMLPHLIGTVSKYRGELIRTSSEYGFFVTYHPSFLQYSGGAGKKDLVKSDFRKLADLVETALES